MRTAIAATSLAFLLGGCSTIGFGDGEDDSRRFDRAAVEDALIDRFGREGELEYAAAGEDLNGDGRAEVVVHIRSRYYCGTGGCNAMVLTPDFEGYRVVMDASVTRTPIGVLESETRGWRDLTVSYSGGGYASDTALMRFDGLSYPSNPTVPPATPTDRRGEVLLGEYPDYRTLVN